MRPLSFLAATSLLALACVGARADRDPVNDAPSATVPIQNMARLTPAAGAAGSRPPLEHPKSSAELIQSVRAEITQEPESPPRASVLRALSELETGAAQVPPEARQGWIDEHLGGFNDAVRELESAAPAPLAGKAARGAAVLNSRAERWEAARDFASKALDYDANDRVALVVRSRANAGLQDYARAFADAERAAVVAPDMAAAYTARASASYGQGRYLETIEDCKRALALDPLDATAFDLMKLSEGHTRTAPDFGGVAPQVSDAVEREYHGMLQQLNQAERTRLAPEEEPRPAAVAGLVSSAGSKLSVKDYWGAIVEADKALAADPSNARALYFRAVAHNLVGQYGEAVHDATNGLAIRPTEVPLLDARSWAYGRMGKLDDSVADAHRALELEPRDAYALANRAFADEQRRDFAAMLEDYRAAAELDPEFEPDYRDAARRHGLEAKPFGRDSSAPAPAAPSRDRTFAIVLVASLSGGLLIGFGLLHVGSSLRTSRAARAEPLTGLEASYELGKPLGEGGMGVVYRGFDRKLRRPVAIKTLRDEFRLDDEAKRDFLEEARTVAELHHPAIVEIYNIVEDERGVALVFELLEGRPLDVALGERKRLTLSETRRVLKPVCAALEYAHARGVVHRDLKPSNVMLLLDGGVKVLDFGISRHAATSSRRKAVTKSIHGTPHYMAPEQEYGTVRKESDMFSLGAVAYEMATGVRPFEGAPAVKLARGYRRPSRVAPGLPLAFDELIDLALEPDPDKRFISPADFWRQLSSIPDAA
jgi:tetratricopeptide (TPR) repeat protein